MDIRFQNASGGQWKADCVLAFVFEKDSPIDSLPALREQAPWLAASPGLRDCTGKKDELSLLYGHPDLSISRVLLCGLGKKEKLDLGAFRDAVARGVARCRDRSFAALGLPVETLDYIVRLGKIEDRETLIREAAVA